MWPDRVSNPGPLTYESGALPTALRGPAVDKEFNTNCIWYDNGNVRFDKIICSYTLSHKLQKQPSGHLERK